MEDCLFCNIVNGKRKGYIVYEDNLVLGILDVDPINKGHILLITKEHRLDIDDLTTEERNQIIEVANCFVKKLKKEYSLDGYSIMQNGGKFNEIGHFHLHVFPRYKGDGFGWLDNETEVCNFEKIREKLKL